MRVGIAQIDPVVGGFEGNVRKILSAYENACAQKARVLLTPELGVCGYPTYDLIDRPEIFERNEKALKDLVHATLGKSCALIVGHVARNPSSKGRLAQNVVSVLQDGKVVFRQAKSLLPSYDVFDESRYFEPANQVELWDCDGVRVAIAICEDLWGKDPRYGHLYGSEPVSIYREKKAQMLFSISSSPYEWGKKGRRESLHRQITQDLGIPLVYVNQVGATDEVLFDGASFAMDQKGVVQTQLPDFEKAECVVSLPTATPSSVPTFVPHPSENPMDVLTQGLVCGIRSYFERTGFKKAVIGLSGGIDSALVAALAVQALGSENVFGIAMPSQYSSAHSLSDAEQLAKNLRMRFEVRPIKFSFSVLSREIQELSQGPLAPLALENLQARLRGIVLMTMANHDSSLVITTGNKSEIAMGYCTLYGDMAGALAPIGDLFKTRVYALARHINQIWNAPIPESTLTKAPSAELRPDQKDQDTLPSYESLDALLEEYLEKDTAIVEIEAKLPDFQKEGKGSVREILRKVEINEYKRRQAAPVLKVSPRAFGVGRRVPIAKKWDQ